MSGVFYNSVISNHYARVELYISRASAEENKSIFAFLFSQRASIEDAFGSTLIWERLDNKKASRIKCELDGVDYFNSDDWSKMIDFMVGKLPKLSLAFSDPIKPASKKIKNLTTAST